MKRRKHQPDYQTQTKETPNRLISHEDSASSELQPDFFTNAINQNGKPASLQSHAATINRSVTGRAGHLTNFTQQLQSTYGNHYVQRVVAQAKAAKSLIQRVSGLATKASLSKYSGKVKDTFENWGSKTAGVRLRNVVGAANEQLAKENVTGLSGEEAALASPGDAEFDFTTWRIKIDPRLLNKSSIKAAEMGKLADSIYHESRHAEQWFRIARLKAGEGKSAAWLKTNLFIPAKVAQDAFDKPLKPLTVAQRAAMKAEKIAAHDELVQEATDWHTSIYGTGRAHRTAVLGDIEARYDEYRALAEEVDAWAVGGEAQKALDTLLKPK